MNANELRIGNWIIEYGIDYVMDNKIIDRDDKQFIIVDCHVIKELQYETENSVLYAPIPLTPEILEKCGLHKENQHIYILPNTTYRMWGFSWTMQQYEISIKDNWVDIHSKSIKHLHQLQNLYYALTGEELTYTP